MCHIQAYHLVRVAQCAEPSWIVLGDDELLKSKPIWHDEHEHLNWIIANA